MQTREHFGLAVRALGQATGYIALMLGLYELLHREGVVRREVLTSGSILALGGVWIALFVHRFVRARAELL